MTNNTAIMISVVRDFDMYRHCVVNNKYNANVALQMFDNRECNEGIPIIYNRFLNAYDYAVPSWFIFCHEDFEMLEPIGERLKDADVCSVYGPIGGKLCQKFRFALGGIWFGEYKGHVIHSLKDASQMEDVGDCSPTGTIVDSVDCQCLIIHSSLVRDYGLRFDENLSFDLYTEDFCLGAMLNHSILTRILSLKCYHHSKGVLQPRFYLQKEYLDAKYLRSEAFSTVGCTIGGGRTLLRRLQKKLRRVMDAKCPWLVKLIFKLLPC